MYTFMTGEGRLARDDWRGTDGLARDRLARDIHDR